MTEKKIADNQENNSAVSCLGLTFKIILIILATKEAFYLGVLLLLYILQQEYNLGGGRDIDKRIRKAHIGVIGDLEGRGEELQKVEDIILSIMDMTMAINVLPHGDLMIEEYNFGFRIVGDGGNSLARKVYASLVEAQKAIDTYYGEL